jgi:hypothetical protein
LRLIGAVMANKINTHLTDEAIFLMNQAYYNIRKLQSEAEDEANYKISLKYSKKFLRFYKSLLKGYKTHNHDIIIREGMGAVWIMVGDKYLTDYNRSTKLLQLLEYIDETLDSSWAYHLANVKIN